MKTYEAIIEAEKVARDLLSEAGLVDGSTKSADEIKETTDTIFWRVSVTSKDGSDKSTYATYEIDSTEPYQSMDGVVVTRKIDLILNLVTRRRKIPEIISDVNDVCLENGFTFELQSTDYEANSKAYVYTFTIGFLLTDGND